MKRFMVRPDEYSLEFSFAVPTGLLAISIVFIQALIPLGKLDVAEFISLLAFAISIPMLICRILIYRRIKKLGFYPSSRIILITAPITQFIGVTGAFIGVVATIWHFSWVIGLLFIGSAFLALIFYEIYSHEFKILEEDLEEGQSSKIDKAEL